MARSASLSTLLAAVLALAAALALACDSLEPRGETTTEADLEGDVDLEADTGWDPPMHATLAVGLDHSCLIADGRLRCWGKAPFWNARPLVELGGRSLPAFLETYPGPVPIAVDTDWGRTCVVADDGTLWCGAEGDLERIAALVDVVEVAIGPTSTCVRLADGRVSCSEDEQAWQAIEGLRAARIASTALGPCAVPIEGGLTCWTRFSGPEPRTFEGEVDVVDLTGGADGVCALDEAGGAWCPGRVEGLDPALDIAVGRGELCAVLRDGEVVCRRSGESFRQVGIDDAVAIDGSEHFCVLRASGEVVCWGDNEHGQTGAPWPLDDGSVVTVALPEITTVAARGDGACAVAVDGDVWCWGGEDATSGVPQRIEGLPAADQIALGDAFGCVRATADRALWCWGRVPAAVLPLPEPTRIDRVGSVDQVAAGRYERCVAQDTTVACTGSGGRCAIGGLPAIENLAQIATGDRFACALDGAGEVSCWGDLPDLDPDLCTVPQPVRSGAEMIAATSRSLCTLDADGLHCEPILDGGLDITLAGDFASIWANQSSQYGQAACALTDQGGGVCLGRLAWPTEDLVDVESLALGDGFGCALQRAGTVVCWGENDVHQLGDGGLDWVDEPWTVDLAD